MWIVFPIAGLIAFIGTIAIMILGATGVLHRIGLQEILGLTRLFLLIPLACGIALALHLENRKEHIVPWRAFLIVLSGITGTVAVFFAGAPVVCEIVKPCF